MFVDSRLQRHLLALTAVLAGLIFFYGLGDIPLVSQNEGRRAVPALNMLLSGDWLIPRTNGEMYLTKPPLVYWLSAGMSMLIGVVNEWSVRLPLAICAALLVVVCYRFARARFGFWPALFAVQILIANVSFAMFARRIEIEMLLTLLCTGSFLAALQYIYGDGRRRWSMLSYALLGAAVLAKGPLAFLFVTLPLLISAAIQKHRQCWRYLGDWRGWLLLLTIALSWYALVSAEYGFGIWQQIVQRDIVRKVASGSADPFYNYLIWVLTDFLPATLVLAIAPRATWKRWREDKELQAMALAVIVPLVLYSLFKDKHAKYLLPLYPIFALLLGRRLGEIFSSAGTGGRRAIIALGVLMPLGYVVFYGALESRIFSDRFSAFKPIAQWMQAAKPLPLYAYGDIDERLVFYARRDIPVVKAEALQPLQASETAFYLLVQKRKEDSPGVKGDCQLKSFSPYLKASRELLVLGFGGACR